MPKQLAFVCRVTAAVALLTALPLSPHAQEATGVVVPPPLSQALSQRLSQYPQARQELMARLPRVPAGLPAPRSPAVEPPASGTWTPLTNAPPASGMSNPVLLTDGTVLFHAQCTSNWYRLTPDPYSSFYNTYINGTWSQISSMPAGYTPLYFASAVLPDGRFIAEGGEYNTSCAEDHTTLGAIYDPLLNTWTSVTPPSGWSTIGDASSIVLSTGQYMLSNCCSTQWAYLNPSNLSWEAHTGSDKGDGDNNEEGWTLLPDGSVVTVDAYVALDPNCPATFGSERFWPRFSGFADDWTSGGTVPVKLPDCGPPNESYEMGPQVLRPDGSVVAFGATTSGVANTAIYNYSASTWAAGPTLPVISGADYNLADAPAALLNNGNILFAASPGLFSHPLHMFEFSAATASPPNTITQVGDITNSASDSSFYVNFLVLPTGQVLETDFSGTVEIYQANGGFNAAWQPTITSSPTNLAPGGTYEISGTQFAGLSQGAMYGDDAQANTNYPLVLIENLNTTHLFYARTFDFSTNSVAAGAAGSTSFTMPANIEPGPSYLYVIADGIYSDPVAVNVTRSAYAKQPVFNGGSMGSILWRYTDGTVYSWNMNGTTIASVGIDQMVSLGWQIAGTGDFNGDGVTDIVWRYNTGEVVIWLMNSNGTIKQVVDNGPVSTGWTIVGTGRFRGQTTSDILWRCTDQTSTACTNGQVVVWLMSSGSLAQVVSEPTVSNDWTIVGAGDFNGDGTSDILWRCTDTTGSSCTAGEVVIWLMTAVTGTVSQVVAADGGAAIPLGWTIAGTGDFNGDGTSDILWRCTDSSSSACTDGTVTIWLMNSNGTIKQVVATQLVSTGWTIIGTSDFNGDGIADILWRFTDGTVAVWLMNNNGTISQTGEQPVSNQWSLIQ